MTPCEVLKMGAARSTETSVSPRNTTRRQNREFRDLNLHRHENLKTVTKRNEVEDEIRRRKHPESACYYPVRKLLPFLCFLKMAEGQKTVILTVSCGNVTCSVAVRM